MDKYIQTSAALDIVNNWGLVSEIYDYHKNNLIFYDNQNQMFIDKGGSKPRPVDELEYNIMLFFQNNKLHYELTIEEFTERFLN
ncbi:MAG: hypothetical protein ACRDD8_14275 [Bacteroidales bacterium]